MKVDRKFAYAGNLAILHYAATKSIRRDSGHGNPNLLSLQMEVQTQYNKDCVGSLPSYNKETRRELNIFVNGQALPFCAESTYLGIKLDRALTFRQHLKSLRKKLTFRVGLLKRLAGSGWDADATLSLVRSTAEYCAPVWCCSAQAPLSKSPQTMLCA